MKEYERKMKCKYCGNTENITQTYNVHKTNYGPICPRCYKILCMCDFDFNILASMVNSVNDIPVNIAEFKTIVVDLVTRYEDDGNSMIDKRTFDDWFTDFTNYIN
jgi:hypothetical protein